MNQNDKRTSCTPCSDPSRSEHNYASSPWDRPRRACLYHTTAPRWARVRLRWCRSAGKLCKQGHVLVSYLTTMLCDNQPTAGLLSPRRLHVGPSCTHYHDCCISDVSSAHEWASTDVFRVCWTLSVGMSHAAYRPYSVGLRKPLCTTLLSSSGKWPGSTQNTRCVSDLDWGTCVHMACSNRLRHARL
jgi:hypothetical protein